MTRYRVTTHTGFMGYHHGDEINLELDPALEAWALQGDHIVIADTDDQPEVEEAGDA